MTPTQLPTAQSRGSRRALKVFKNYLAIARPEHWIKNIFMVLGSALALILQPVNLGPFALGKFAIALVATCLIASSNYVLNEILDASRDREHPTKHLRPLASKSVSVRGAYFLWFFLGFAGLFIGWVVNPAFFISGVALWIMGIVYNVPPLRTKEIPVLDVLSEAINNPIRLLMGWYALGVSDFPPSSILFAYWTFGAFGMAAKRLAEYREIGDRTIAAAYRNSFAWYTEDRLVISIVAYSSGFMFFLAVAMTKYHPELILSAPLFMVLMAFILKLTFEPHSILQHPERLFKRPLFVVYLTLMLVLLYFLYLTTYHDLRIFFRFASSVW
jgi:4-hydroxybenzoate polyprenyltransferase